MDLQMCDWETFLDFTAEMPDVEVVDHIDARLRRIKDDRWALGASKDQQPLREALNTEDASLRLMRNQAVRLIEKRKWSRAVRSIFGEDGLEQCLHWMRLQPGGEIQDIHMSHTGARLENKQPKEASNAG